MGDHLEEDAVKAVRSIKDAVEQAQLQLEAAGLALAKVELELGTSLTKSAGGAFKLKIVELGAHRARTDAQTLTLDLTPGPAAEPMGPSLAEQLQQAIVATASAAAEAAATEPRFDLERAVVALQVSISKDGKVSIFVEGTGEQGTTNTLTLTLKPIGVN
jgi:hypothetical protein